MIKKFLNRLGKAMLLLGVVSLSACQNANASSTQNETPAQNEMPAQTEASDETETSEQDSGRPPGEPLTMLQLQPLQKGEELAVLHTSMGDIKLRFFPEEAPLAVENFITHAKNGYYDGVIFHRVINDFMIQGGDPKGTGTGGESIWGGGFGYEYSMALRHFRGALAMAHSEQPDSNGSQFYIVQNKTLNSNYKGEFEELYESQDEIIAESEDGKKLYVKDVFPTALLDEYINNGGTPHLDLVLNENGHTVFGHVVEGMDVVDAIAAVEVNNSIENRPVADVIVESISFEIY